MSHIPAACGGGYVRLGSNVQWVRGSTQGIGRGPGSKKHQRPAVASRYRRCAVVVDLAMELCVRG